MAASKVLTRRGRGALRHRGRHGSARFGRVPRAVGERGGRAPAKAGRFWRLEARAQAVEPLRTRLVPAPPKTKDGEYSEDGRSYLEEYVLGDCETIEGGELVSPVVITKIIESLAIGHFQKLSGDQSDVPRSKEMKELDLTFMLSRITFAFKSLPASDHQVQAETCFKPQKVSFKRDFAVRNTATGAIVAAATSTYVLVNFKTRKLSGAPKEMVDLYKDYNAKNSAEKLGTELPKKSKLPTFTSDDEEAKPSTTYVVEDTDIDLNGELGAIVSSSPAPAPPTPDSHALSPSLPLHRSRGRIRVHPLDSGLRRGRGNDSR